MSRALVSCACLLLVPSVIRGAGEADAIAILRAADASRQAIEEGVIRVRATVEMTGRPSSVHELEVYVRGSDRVLCIFRAGELKGRRVLTVGDRGWLLVPGTAHPIPISAGQRLLGGASVADLARLRFADDFVGTLRSGEENVNGTACRALDLAAKSSRAAYRSGTLWAGVDDDLPRRVRLSLPSGKEAKEILFTAYERTGGRPILHAMTIRHLLRSEKDTITTLEFERYEARPLESRLFDPLHAMELP
jgi:outer membrane lipoprotein-sorting protein